MDERSSLLLFAFVLCLVGALVYLDWRRQGEIVLLHERVDEHETAFSEVAASLVALQRHRPVVERILHATDDRTLADIAREGAL